MGNKLLLVLVAVALAASAFFLLKAPADPEQSAQGAIGLAERTEEPSAAPKTAPDALDSEETAPNLDAAAPAAAREEVAIDTTPDWAGADAEEREGQILIPPGTPADEELTVTIQSLDVESKLEYAVKVAADGRFKFFMPPGKPALTIELDAHYLYLDEAYPVSVDSVVLAPNLGARISGQLLGPADQEEVNFTTATIKSTVDLAAGFSPATGQDMARAFPDANPDATGAFELEALPANLAFALAVDATEYPLVTRGGLDLAPGEHRQLTIQLDRGAVIAGLVVDTNGEPIEGCRLECMSGGQFDLQAQFEKRRGRSDEAGAFRIAGLATGQIRVTATVAGFIQEAPLVLEVSSSDPIEEVRIVLSRGAQVAGMVVDQTGAPVASADVALRFDPAALNGLNAQNAGVGASGSDRTDEEGRFVIEGLGAGPFMISAELLDGDTWSYGKAAGIKPGAMDVTVAVRLMPALTGRVVDAANKPIEKFRLELQAGNLGGLMAGNQVTQDVEDPDGRFNVPRVIEGEWNLYVSADGFGRVGPVDADRPGPGEAELTVHMQRGVTAHGMVVDPSGSPVSGATVKWQADAGDLVLNVVGLAPKITDTTDEAGAFELTDLPAGSLSLNASSEAWASAETLTVSAAPDEVLEDLVFTLRTGGSIEGLFLNSEGDPEVGALVQIQKPGGGGQTITSSDDRGEFFAEKLEPGKWQIVGIPADTQSANDQSEMLKSLKMDMVDVVDGETTKVTLGAPPEDPVHVRGRVEPGENVAGGIAIFVPEGKGLLGGMRMASIDKAGHFELDLDKPGNYVVTIQNTPEGGVGQDNVEFQETIPKKPEVSLVFKLPGGSISGRVTDSKGSPLGAVRVSLYADGGTSTGTMSGGKYTETTTKADGTYHVGHLRPGTYTVGAGGRSIAAVFDSAAGFGREVQPGLQVGLDKELGGVDFELAAAGSIEGRVVDSSGGAVAGASLFVRDKDDVLLERISLATSGADGSFSYGGVAAGSYTISARSKTEVSPAPVSVTVHSDENSVVELTLDQGTILEVSVVDGNSQPISANLQVLDGNGRDVAGQFGMADLTELLSSDFSLTTQRFGPLPPGKYKVTGASGDLSGKKPVTLSGQEKRRIKLRLK